MNSLIMGEEEKKYEMYNVREYKYFYLTSGLNLIYCTHFFNVYELMSTKI